MCDDRGGLCILCQKKRHRQIGVGLVGFGLLFIGMDMMQEPLAFLKQRPEMVTVFGDHLFWHSFQVLL